MRLLEFSFGRACRHGVFELTSRGERACLAKGHIKHESSAQWYHSNCKGRPRFVPHRERSSSLVASLCWPMWGRPLGYGERSFCAPDSHYWRRANGRAWSPGVARTLGPRPGLAANEGPRHLLLPPGPRAKTILPCSDSLLVRPLPCTRPAKVES